MTAAEDIIKNLSHDGSVMLAMGRSRKETSWKNKSLSWGEFLEKISQTTRTHETLAEYKALPKARQDEIKDVGGFVGGTLKGGNRKADSVQGRHLLTLDADHIKAGFDMWSLAEIAVGAACAMYSTHKHETKQQRYRLVFPLRRAVTAEEYQAIGRKVAELIDIDSFDDTTYEAHRLMYWPSTSKDGEYVFKVLDEPWLDPDEILAMYPDWKDPSYWPESSRKKSELRKMAERQGDPLEKPGLIGAFCRTYTIGEAIEKFLPDVYEPVGDGRYTYLGGSTAGGLVVYDTDTFAYSHHGTDPCGGKLVNAFDMVRVHKFGVHDEGAAEGTPVNSMPSFKRMKEFAASLPEVKILLGKEAMDSAGEDFTAVEVEGDDAWLGELDRNENGALKNTPHNFALILANDSNLKGKMAHNEFSNRICVLGDLPWRKEGDNSDWKDSDDSSLRIYISRVWAIMSKQGCEDALKETVARNAYHPVREYLNSLEWDGVQRVDRLLIDYMGAEDSEYTRLVMRKWMCGAVARIFVPGIKFDHMLVLTGAQGIYKSTFFSTLAKGWFTDSIQEVEGNQAVEKLLNSWIIEFGELQAFSKSESNAIKRFITSQEDRTRLAFDRRTSYLKRQCVFAGTTNKFEFLKDETGDRRYWPVEVKAEGRTKDVRDDMPKELDQIWAEAVQLWKSGERLALTREQEAIARVRQETHREVSEKEGVILKFLDTPLPTNWDELPGYKKRSYLEGGEPDLTDFAEGFFVRDKVCALEVWCECFGKSKADMKKGDSIEINNILSGLKGWTKAKKSGYRFTLYGKQRYYERETKSAEQTLTLEQSDKN